MLGSSPEEAFQPAVGVALDTVHMELLQKYGVVYLIEGFAEIKIQNISIFVEEEEEEEEEED